MKIRQRLRLPLHCPVIFATDTFVAEGKLIDLGVPGCAVESDVVPLPNDYVRLSIHLHGDRFEINFAKVRWSERRRFGVEFLSFCEGHGVTVHRLFQAFDRLAHFKRSFNLTPVPPNMFRRPPANDERTQT